MDLEDATSIHFAAHSPWRAQLSDRHSIRSSRSSSPSQTSPKNDNAPALIERRRRRGRGEAAPGSAETHFLCSAFIACLQAPLTLLYSSSVSISEHHGLGRRSVSP